MFKGYKLSRIDFKDNLDHYYAVGNKLFKGQSNTVKSKLDEFFLSDKSLDGVKIIDSWFPEIKANVFLSHAHRDSKEVVALSGWLYENFGIIAFIDSCVWGYGNDLIQILDNQYSRIDEKQNLYNYKKVLLSASHVHMMLSTALNSMIDKTECLIFYDTPNSIKSFESKDKTESPWIYSEIAFSEIARMRHPIRLTSQKPEIRAFKEGGKLGGIEKGLKVKYDARTKHLKDITVDHLNEWFNSGTFTSVEEALDKFYEITFPLPILIQ
ncbi:hypothetical protein DF185_09785 [Marinifilum breve]|uniref:TIR domain-containing protein n=1 Tax=Marinifilum breve TaxID=2184082 RepID=A0A2V3ZYL3_9BACT|nr:hypothetical protein [Marinifilum breve]PXY01745.1 hypothetical protein DF185_09785 [Marinifilum breve]